MGSRRFFRWTWFSKQENEGRKAGDCARYYRESIHIAD
jgi:hypothetical protein